MSRSPVHAVAALFSLALLAAQGCSDPKPKMDPEHANVVGIWIESRDSADPALSDRMAPPAQTGDLRILQMDQAGTFRLFFGDAAGRQKGEGVVEGTWKIEGDRIVFGVTSNTVTVPEFYPPLRTPGAKTYHRGEASGLRLLMQYEDGPITSFKRANE